MGRTHTPLWPYSQAPPHKYSNNSFPTNALPFAEFCSTAPTAGQIWRRNSDGWADSGTLFMQTFPPFLEREKEEDRKKRTYEKLTNLSTAFPSLCPTQRVLVLPIFHSLVFWKRKGKVILEDSTEKISENKRKTAPRGHVRGGSRGILGSKVQKREPGEEVT